MHQRPNPILWVAIIPSARNHLTFKAIEANNRQR
jgi:hypothetical protein